MASVSLDCQTSNFRLSLSVGDCNDTSSLGRNPWRPFGLRLSITSIYLLLMSDLLLLCFPFLALAGCPVPPECPHLLVQLPRAPATHASLLHSSFWGDCYDSHIHHSSGVADTKLSSIKRHTKLFTTSDWPKGNTPTDFPILV